MKELKNFSCAIFASLVLLTAMGCSNNDEDDTPEGTNNTTQINYADQYNWVSLPHALKLVDVFYVYPTVSGNETGTMDITNEDERALAEGIFQSQATVFQEDANIFAPYYRQMSTACTSDDPNMKPTDIPEFKLGLADVTAAFEYFLENLNEDRPFIIAGHSQGSMAVLEILKDKFGNDETLCDRLIAAYVIGWSVTDEDLQEAGIPLAQGPDDVGVIITYNTQSRTSAGGPMLLPGAHCINPLNWSTDATVAPATENKGAMLYNNDTGELIREVDEYCDAEIKTSSGGLMTTIPQADADTLVFGDYEEGVYHRYDYAFWYRNLQENVGVRINAYLNKN